MNGAKEVFGVLIYPGVEELDFQGPWQIAGMWHTYAGGPKPRLIAHSSDVVACANGMRVLPDITFADAPQLAYLVVPGGFAAFDAMKDEALTGFVHTQSYGVRALLSVCSGSFILLAAGILAGRKAATNWKTIDRLRTAGIQVIEQRFVQDGCVWTAAGVSAGIDATLALIAAEAGDDAASTVQLNAEYYPDQRTYGVAHRLVPGAAYFRSL